MLVKFKSHPRFSILRQNIGTFLWKWRKMTGLLAILALQLASAYGLQLAAHHGLQHWASVANVVLTSGLVLYFMSGNYGRLVEVVMYGPIRKNWKDVRVMYAEEEYTMLGVGGFYPREPTLLLHAPMLPFNSPSMDRAVGVPAQLAVSFNNAYLAPQDEEKDEQVTGQWTKLEVTPVEVGGGHMNWVGFPRPLVTLGRVPRKPNPASPKPA